MPGKAGERGLRVSVGGRLGGGGSDKGIAGEAEKLAIKVREAWRGKQGEGRGGLGETR